MLKSSFSIQDGFWRWRKKLYTQCQLLIWIYRLLRRCFCWNSYSQKILSFGSFMSVTPLSGSNFFREAFDHLSGSNFQMINLVDHLSILLSLLVTQVEVPDRKSICPDRPRRKVSMSRPSQTESAYVQTFVRYYYRMIIIAEPELWSLGI